MGRGLLCLQRYPPPIWKGKTMKRRMLFEIARRSLLGIAALVSTTPLVRGADAPASPAPMRLIEGLGPHTRKVTTKSPQAQKYFEQGLNLIFGFNHGSAIRSFQEAARLDPECAMAH